MPAAPLRGRLTLAFLALLAECLHLSPRTGRKDLLGFVLGMSWTFGAVLPAVIGGALALLSLAARGLARWAWRAARRGGPNPRAERRAAP